MSKEMEIPEGMFTLNPMSEPDIEEQEQDQQQPGGLTEEAFKTLIEQQNKDREANERRWEQMLRGTQQKVTAPKPKFELNLDGLPDPRQDLEGYHKGLGERLGKLNVEMMSAAEQRANEILNSRQNSQQLIDNAWVKFQELHPELSEYPELVQSAATSISHELQQRGMNMVEALSTDPDSVIKAVADRVDGTVKKIRGLKTADGDERGSGRSVNMLGGAGPKPKAKTEEKVVSLTDELKRAQKAMGLY